MKAFEYGAAIFFICSLISVVCHAGKPLVGMWYHSDHTMQQWMEDLEANTITKYHHSRVDLSNLDYVHNHAEVYALNNDIFAEPVPWLPFLADRTYNQYLTELNRKADSRAWLERLSFLRSELLASPNIERKIVYIYARYWGHPDYNRAWPPANLDGSWPLEFQRLGPDNAPVAKQRMAPSYRPDATRKAIANLTYFYLKYFEGVGAKQYFSPWREHNAFGVNEPEKDIFDNAEDILGAYNAMVQRLASGDLNLERIAVFPTWQLEWSAIRVNGELTNCVSASTPNKIKSYYTVHEGTGVPTQISLSSYLNTLEYGELDHHARLLRHLLDNLYMQEGTSCDGNMDGIVREGESVWGDDLTDVTIPGSVPLSYAELSRPGWLGGYPAWSDDGFRTMEKRSLAFMNFLLNMNYVAPDGKPAYPLDFVAFTHSLDWSVPAKLYEETDGWIRFGAGLATGSFNGRRIKPSGLLADSLINEDLDYDNVKNITIIENPLDNSRDLRRGIDDKYFKTVPNSFGTGNYSIRKTVSLEDIYYTVDNCPVHANSDQSDVDSDGIGDACDNCVDSPNYRQTDWDQDGIGNDCDKDFNNDGMIASDDRAILVQCVNASSQFNCFEQYPHFGLNGKSVYLLDLNDDNRINSDDIAIWDEND